MARPRKTGLDYFPFDCDFFEDRKMIAISGEFGINGEIVAVKLLCEIFRNGYFIEWDELLKFKLAHICPGVSPEIIEQIVRRLVSWGFFDQGLYESTQILTSVDIQERYFNVAKYRITSRELPYLLLDPVRNFTRTGTKTAQGISGSETGVSQRNSSVSQCETSVAGCKTTVSDCETETSSREFSNEAKSPAQNSVQQAFSGPSEVSQGKTSVSQCETGVSQKSMPQIKLNKRKEKRKNSLSRVKKNAVTGVCPAPSLDEVTDFFKANHLPSSPDRFFNYYNSRGWMAGRTPVSDWKSLALTWDSREEGFPKHKAGDGSITTRGKTEAALLAELDKRKARERAEATAKEKESNPNGLSAAEILAEVKIRHGLDPNLPLAQSAI